MTAHQLAELLLKLPDLDVIVPEGEHADLEIVTDVALCQPRVYWQGFKAHENEQAIIIQ